MFSDSIILSFSFLLLFYFIYSFIYFLIYLVSLPFCVSPCFLFLCHSIRSTVTFLAFNADLAFVFITSIFRLNVFWTLRFFIFVESHWVHEKRILAGVYCSQVSRNHLRLAEQWAPWNTFSSATFSHVSLFIWQILK